MKKGAMFGIESRTLKKQFGKLLLMRMQSVATNEAHRARMQSNRGAMFGLDARIALAIFGALSIISGAALYSAIQQTKVTQLHQEFVNIEKAIEAYMLDTGVNMPLKGSHLHNANIGEIFTSSNPNWKGPYLAARPNSAAPTASYVSWPNPLSQKSNLFIHYANPNGNTLCSVGDDNCFYRIMINMIDSNIAKKFDVLIDGVEDSDSGRVILIPHTSQINSSVFYYAIPVMR